MVLWRWSRDGRTIVYSTLQQQWAAADVSVLAGQIRVERVRESSNAVGVSGTGYAWDMTPDGKRFLLNLPQDPTRDIAVALNWTALLRK